MANIPFVSRNIREQASSLFQIYDREAFCEMLRKRGVESLKQFLDLYIENKWIKPIESGNRQIFHNGHLLILLRFGTCNHVTYFAGIDGKYDVEDVLSRFQQCREIEAEFIAQDVKYIDSFFQWVLDDGTEKFDPLCAMHTKAVIDVTLDAIDSDGIYESQSSDKLMDGKLRLVKELIAIQSEIDRIVVLAGTSMPNVQYIFARQKKIDKLSQLMTFDSPYLAVPRRDMMADQRMEFIKNRNKLLIHEEYQELINLYQKNINLYNSTDFLHASLETATGCIYKDFLKKNDKAIAAFRNAINLDPDNVKAFNELRAVLSASSKWSELHDLLADHWKNVENANKMIKEEISRCKEDMLLSYKNTLSSGIVGDDDVKGLYDFILSLDKEEIVTYLEKIETQCINDDLMQMIGNLYQSILSSDIKDFQKRTLLERYLGIIIARGNQVDIDKFIQIHAQLYAISPSDKLFNILKSNTKNDKEMIQRWTDSLEKLVAQVKDEITLQRIYLTLAECYKTILDNPGKTADVLMGFLQVAPDNVNAYKTCFNALERLERFDDCIGISRQFPFEMLSERERFGYACKSMMYSVMNTGNAEDASYFIKILVLDNEALFPASFDQIIEKTQSANVDRLIHVIDKLDCFGNEFVKVALRLAKAKLFTRYEKIDETIGLMNEEMQKLCEDFHLTERALVILECLRDSVQYPKIKKIWNIQDPSPHVQRTSISKDNVTGKVTDENSQNALMLKKVLSLGQKKDFEGAIGILDELIQKEGNIPNVDIHRQKATYLSAMGNHQAAIDTLAQASARVDDMDVVLDLDIDICFLMREINLADAELFYRSLLVREIESNKLRLLSICFDIDAGRFAEAEKVIDELLETDDVSIQIASLEQKLRLQSKRKDPKDQIRRTAGVLISISPDNPSAHAILG